jgi:hypothetical protein
MLTSQSDAEVWHVDVTVGGFDASFEYVISCKDYRGGQVVKEIFNNQRRRDVPNQDCGLLTLISE